MSFPVGHAIAVPGKPLRHFYFPTSGVLSALVQLQEDGTAETLVIGSEWGWLGFPYGLDWAADYSLAEDTCWYAQDRRRERLLKRFTASTVTSRRLHLFSTAAGTRSESICAGTGRGPPPLPIPARREDDGQQQNDDGNPFAVVIMIMVFAVVMPARCRGRSAANGHY